jgi:signal peptide peptidase SppA
MDTQSLKETVKKFIKEFLNLPLIEKILHPGPRVAVLRLSGIIADHTMRRAGISHARYSRLIEKAFAMSKLEAVALVINSPGGAPAQSSLIASHIRRLSEEKKKPVFAFVEDVAASGGYWLACAGDEIYVQESSIVGSIGVISASFGLDEFIKKHDITRRMHTSGKDKSFLDPFLPEKEGDVTRLKKIQSEIHASFKDWVKERRGKKLKGTERELFEGNFWSGSQAIEKGLADDMGEMRAIMCGKFGDKVRFSELQPEKKLIPSFLRSETRHDEMLHEALDIIEEKVNWSRFGL